MADSYLTVAAIAADEFMRERVTACVTEQFHLNGTGNPQNASDWTYQNRYVWASSPTWDEKWRYALAVNGDKPDYEPGKDEAVITDGDILATVQQLTGAPVAAE